MKFASGFLFSFVIFMSIFEADSMLSDYLNTVNDEQQVSFSSRNFFIWARVRVKIGVRVGV